LITKEARKFVFEGKDNILPPAVHTIVDRIEKCAAIVR